MTNTELVSRPDLQVRSDVSAFAFPLVGNGKAPAEGELTEERLARITEEARARASRYLVLDLGPLKGLSVEGLARVLELRERLKPLGCRLALVVRDPVLRKAFLGFELDRRALIFEDELQLRRALPSGDRGPGFTAEQLAEMEAKGASLDDLIRELDARRG